MPDLTIQDIPGEEYSALEARAARHGRTVEEEARHLLHEAAAEQMLVTQLERVTQAAATKRGSTPAAPPRNTGRPRSRRATEPTPGRR
jgi:plasmid stability protein